MKEEKIKPILVRPSPELRRRIEREAKEQHRSMGNLLLVIAVRFFSLKDGAPHATQEGR